MLESEKGNPIGGKERKTKVLTLNMNVRHGIAWILCNSDWTIDKINSLIGVGFAHDADVVIVSETEGSRHALKCVSLPLHYYMQTFLLPFGWTEDSGILFSPKESCLNGGDLIALIENSRKAFHSPS